MGPLVQERARGNGRIFVVDSHQIYRVGICAVLESRDHLSVVGESDSIAASVLPIVSTDPDVVVVGVRPGEHSDLGHLRTLSAHRPETAVMVLTRHDDDDTLMAAVEIGARAYLSREISAAHLTSSIDAVAAGEDLLDHGRVVQAMHRRSQRRSAEDPLAVLTKQERRILALVGAGMTNRQIADQLFLVEKTVRNHLTRILAKLNVSRRTQAALVAVRHGLTPESDGAQD